MSGLLYIRCKLLHLNTSLTKSIPKNSVCSLDTEINLFLISNIFIDKTTGGSIEDDMILPSFNRKSQVRGAAVLAIRKWPNKIIPYDISAISSKTNLCIN